VEDELDGFPSRDGLETSNLDESSPFQSLEDGIGRKSVTLIALDIRFLWKRETCLDCWSQSFEVDEG